MASVLHSPLPLSHIRTSSSKSASTSVSTFPATQGVRRHSPALRRRSCGLEDDVICRTSIGEVTFIQPPESAPPKEDPIGPLKIKLLSAVSGLNRGLAASEDDLRRADDAAKELEASGGAVNIPANLDKLQGRWKLIYSSAFSSRTLGGSRPGPPTGRLLPITLGQVFQRIDIYGLDFDNIVELELGAPWPLPPVEVTATLAHKFELVGNTGIKINFEKTTVKTTGTLSQLPALDIPQLPESLRPQTNRGSGEFEVTYLDSDLRITRGDREELRVFVVA